MYRPFAFSACCLGSHTGTDAFECPLCDATKRSFCMLVRIDDAEHGMGTCNDLEFRGPGISEDVRTMEFDLCRGPGETACKDAPCCFTDGEFCMAEGKGVKEGHSCVKAAVKPSCCADALTMELERCMAFGTAGGVNWNIVPVFWFKACSCCADVLTIEGDRCIGLSAISC